MSVKMHLTGANEAMSLKASDGYQWQNELSGTQR